MDTTFFQMQSIKVLLIEDDEDDYIITRELFSEIRGQQFVLNWVQQPDKGLEAMLANKHDVILVDYRLGSHTGVDLLKAALERGCQSPIILLTGSAQIKVDLEAMKAGADDYLVKAQLRADSLERSIRYALQRKRAAAIAAFEQARLAAFGAEIGLALTRRDCLDSILERCAKSMGQYLTASLAQIWTFDQRKQAFEHRAAVGPLVEGELSGSTPPEVRLDVGTLSQGQPVFIRNVTQDPRFPDKNWLTQQNVACFAACPLVLEDKLVGLMSVFTQHQVSEQILQEMGSVANGIALCIERKRSEQALDASEVRYRSVVDNIKEIIFQMDEFGNWTMLNPAWTIATGFDVTQTLGTFFLDYVYEEDKEHNRQIFLKLIERKMDYCRHETRFLTRNGKVRWMEVYLQLTCDNSGTLASISGTLTDITDRKTAEMQIQKLAAFPQVNPNPVLEFACDGSLSYSNEAARDLVRKLGKDSPLNILPDNAPTIVQECLATGHKRLREAISIDGRTFSWSFFPIVNSQVVHCYGADVTDILNLEAQFRHAQKLESVGQLAAGVAHDFNNILTVIQGYSSTLKLKCNGDAAMANGLHQISTAAERAAALTRQLLMFARKQVIQPKSLDINCVLQNIANMLLRLLGEDIALVANYANALPLIKADAGMLEQIVMNLAVNARDAMPKGGKLVISTTSVEIGESYVSQHSEAHPGSFVRLSVTDTGCGMDRRTLERIFEPFFSTKEVGKGTGLGLATVYGIVKQHQGWIEVASEVNRGSTFHLYFPSIGKTIEAVDSGKPSFEAAIQGGSETVLVVEDESMLRELVREVLTNFGYRVVEAHSGVEALRLWDEFDGEVDLLLTDMVMPEGLSGVDLARQLRQRSPDLRVILSSGYSAELLDGQGLPPSMTFLPKPYQPMQLAKLVRHALDRQPQVVAVA